MALYHRNHWHYITGICNELGSIAEKTISNTTVNTKTGTLVKQATQGSELINYKLLSKIHDFKNSDQIDLFPVMDKDILMFINFRKELIKHDETSGSKNAQDWWDYLRPGMQPRGKMLEQPYKTFSAAVDKFNTELKFYLNAITESVNEYLDKFNQNFIVRFDYEPCTYDAFIKDSTTKRNHKTIAPKIYLKASFNHPQLDEIKKDISRLHTFFNEARLTAVALSLRFAMLDLKISAKSSDDTPNILILDDILISLDMSNREKVLDIILNEFSHYQLIVFSHSRSFIELLNHKINQLNQKENWKGLEFYASEKDSIPQPHIKKSESYLEKAEKFFIQKEYEASGNFLRKEAEAFCKDFLPKKYHFTKEYNLHDLNGLIKQLVKYAEGCGLQLNPFKELDDYRKFVLNPSSHDSYNVPKFNSEIKKCLETLKALRRIKNEPFLKRGEELEFELTENDTSDIYEFQVRLEDDFRLIKEMEKDSILSKGMINYWVTKNGEKGELQHCNTTIKGFYDKCYAKSDKTNSPDFWEGVSLSDTGEKLSTERMF